jgi:hypothetical protein
MKARIAVVYVWWRVWGAVQTFAYAVSGWLTEAAKDAAGSIGLGGSERCLC